MPWVLLRYITGQSHFVTFRYYHRRLLLTTSANYQVFESALERVRHSYELRVYA